MHLGWSKLQIIIQKMIPCHVRNGRLSYLEGHSPVSPPASRFLLETISLGTAWRTGPLLRRNGAAPGCRSACFPQKSAQSGKQQQKKNQIWYFTFKHTNAIMSPPPWAGWTLGPWWNSNLSRSSCAPLYISWQTLGFPRLLRSLRLHHALPGWSPHARSWVHPDPPVEMREA